MKLFIAARSLREYGYLQEAAGAFVQLREGPSLKVEQPRPIDISPECAAMLEKLCLAQAQECTFEKARLDKKNPAILARLHTVTSPSQFATCVKLVKSIKQFCLSSCMPNFDFYDCYDCLCWGLWEIAVSSRPLWPAQKPIGSKLSVVLIHLTFTLKDFWNTLSIWSNLRTAVAVGERAECICMR